MLTLTIFVLKSGIFGKESKGTQVDMTTSTANKDNQTIPSSDNEKEKAIARHRMFRLDQKKVAQDHCDRIEKIIHGYSFRDNKIKTIALRMLKATKSHIAKLDRQIQNLDNNVGGVDINGGGKGKRGRRKH